MATKKPRVKKQTKKQNESVDRRGGLPYLPPPAGRHHLHPAGRRELPRVNTRTDHESFFFFGWGDGLEISAPFHRHCLPFSAPTLHRCPLKYGARFAFYRSMSDSYGSAAAATASFDLAARQSWERGGEEGGVPEWPEERSLLRLCVLNSGNLDGEGD